MLFLIISCEGQKKESDEFKKVEKLANPSHSESTSINFLDKKFQTNGFILPDNSPSYPSYSYLDRKIGSFSVNYVARNFTTQYFWDVQNKNSFFSKYKIPEDGAIDSKNIQKFINPDDYYIIADILPSKYITFLGGQDDDFEPKENSITSFYLFENNKWILLENINTNKIPKNIFQYYIKLIQTYKFKQNKISQQYSGSFSINVETEATTTGMASISYNFIISRDKVVLKKNTYHESIQCEGEYKAIEKNGSLELYYFGEDEECFYIDPKFYIKYEKGKYFIKGVGGEGTVNEWLEMKKDK